MSAELAATRLAIQMVSFTYKGMKVVTILGEKAGGLRVIDVVIFPLEARSVQVEFPF